MIELRAVTKRYADVAAVRGVTLLVAKGELVALVGGSGSGNTTLLKMVNRLIEPDEGEVLAFGRDVRSEPAVALRRTIGYVIQHVGLLPHLTVEENVAMVPRLLRWSREDARARVLELLGLVGLPPATYKDRFPDELSGGQRQRVGLARALASRPQVLLLDEPFGALDPITRASLQGELRTIHRELGLTMLMVTHDMVEALTLADRVAVMKSGELRQVATPAELMRSPADAYVAELVSMAEKQATTLLDLGGR
jgi:osmoprotectant transport system ATP-binding protein